MATRMGNRAVVGRLRASHGCLPLRRACLALPTRAAAAAAAGAQAAGAEAVVEGGEALSAPTQRALLEAGIGALSPVQRGVLPEALDGADVLARARTGTGKTLAFLLPTAERLKASGPPARACVRALVVSPTRELAQQVAVEAGKVLSPYGMAATAVTGGTNVKREATRLSQGVDVLVATPGRFMDHMENTRGFAAMLGSVETLVLDECDQLLAAGFRNAVMRIIDSVPAQRQTLCVSATLPDDVRDVLKRALRKGHAVVDCVGDGDDAGQTHASIPQSYATHALGDSLTALISEVRAETEARPKDHKVIAFFPTAKQTAFAAEVMRGLGMQVLEMHSRKTQAHRERTAAQFRAADAAVMVSSDVSARGVDYPDVSLVLQCGMPSSREQYVHRLGRTGRAGKADGRGRLILADFERKFVSKALKDMPLERIDGPTGEAGQDGALAAAVREAAARVDNKTAASTYVAFLGYYKTGAKFVGLDAERLVQTANEYASAVLGRDSPPELEAKTVGKMGLKGVPGLVIGPPRARNGDGGARGGPRAGGGRRAGGGGGDGGGGRGRAARPARRRVGAE